MGIQALRTLKHPVIHPEVGTKIAFPFINELCFDRLSKRQEKINIRAGAKILLKKEMDAGVYRRPSPFVLRYDMSIYLECTIYALWENH